MMKKKYLMTVMMAALLMAGCAGSDDGLQAEKPSPTDVTPADGKYPIGFNVYADRGITRGGSTGLTDITALRKDKDLGGGFGVFAYYTDLKKYDQTYVPNIMYNQKVYDANVGVGDASWTYTPLVYWPNESGADAQSDDEDKVSFFAYAPYVQHTSAASGSVADATYGITGFSRNTATGDPLVKYIANFNTANTVDLCWGVCGEPSWAKIQGGTSQAMTTGLPWLNVEHPQTVDQKMKFTFKHALAQLNVQIDADVDVTAHATDDVVDGNTKVYVRSISFTGIALKGALNLNNTTANQALWLDYAGITDLPYGESITVKDGRRDGREGATGAEAINETPAGLNPEIIQNSTATTGVTTTYQNLFSPSGAIADPLNPTADELAARLKEPVYVIPTGEAMTVTIVYDVETVSPLLNGYLSDGVTHGTSIENKITKTIYYNGSPLSMESGKKYTLGLHLGMNSVKFDASVDSWDNTIINASGWLPENVSAVRINNNGVQVTHSTMSLSDATLALTGAVAPSTADQTLTWTSSDDAIATVAANGTVTAVADGECTITATSVATGKSATMKLLVTHKYSDVAVADVGKIIAANGYIYANTTKAAEYGTNGVGLICYAGAAGTADYSTTVDPNCANYKALALALSDANNGETCQWSNSASVIDLTNSQGTYSTMLSAPATYLTGIDNTATLVSDGHIHAAASAAKTYGVDVSGFTNSGWFLPSICQWNLMIKTLAPTSYLDYPSPGSEVKYYAWTSGGATKDVPRFQYINDGYTALVINPHLTAVGAVELRSYYYWSSSEISFDAAWRVRFQDGAMCGLHKTNYHAVRAAFAF